MFLGGGGDFHPECNTAVESHCKLDFWTPNSRRIPEFGHPVDRSTEILVPKQEYRIRKALFFLSASYYVVLI